MENLGRLLEITIILVALVVACGDLRVHKIKNLWVVVLLILNIFLLIINHTNTSNLEIGIERILLIILKTALLIFILYPFFSIGAIGAGDVKLIAAVSIGTEDPFHFSLIVFSIAATMSLARIALSANARERFLHLTDYVKYIFFYRVLPPQLYDAPMDTNRLKHVIHISVPVLAALLWEFVAKSV